jgi:serine/threonine protein kinase/WD40 repeat protein
MALIAPATLLDSLRTHQLLLPEQLDQLRAELGTQPVEPAIVAQTLLQRGWLTAFQVQQLVTGQISSLLFGPFVLLDVLGEGGMGRVYKARKWRIGRLCALKVIKPDHRMKATVARRFQREMRAVAALTHPNIALAFDAGQEHEQFYLEMEYVDGVDLHHTVRERGPLPVGEVWVYAYQTALALQHAHERGLIHRDIKPSNLLRLRSGYTIKLLDMGLARFRPGAFGSDSSTSFTQVGGPIGTPDFMSPEQVQDASKADIRSDLYSLGCTLFFLLAGRAPFVNGTPMERMMAHCLEAPPAIETLRPDIPAGLANVLRRLLAKLPEERYADPLALLAALEAIRHDRTPASATPTPLDTELTFGNLWPDEPSSENVETIRQRLAQDSTRAGWYKGFTIAVTVLASLLLTIAASVWANRPRPVPTIATESEVVDPAQSAADALTVQAMRPNADREALRRDVLAYLQDFPGYPATHQVAGLLRRLPAPFDTLPLLAPRGNLTELVASWGHGHRSSWGSVRALAFGSSGKMLVSSGSDPTILQSLYPTWQRKNTYLGHTRTVHSVALTPNERYVIATGDVYEHRTTIWDTPSGQEVNRLAGTALSVAACLDNQRFVRGGYGHVSVWSIWGSEPIWRANIDSMNWVATVAVSPDGTHFATGSNDQRVRWWKLSTAAPEWVSPNLGLYVTQVFFGPRGQRLYAVAHGKLRCFELPGGMQVWETKLDDEAPVAALSPNGKALAVTGQVPSIRWYDPGTGQLVATTPGNTSWLPLRALAFTPDNQTLIAAGDDRFFHEFDVESRREVNPPAEPRDTTALVAFNLHNELLIARPWEKSYVWTPPGKTALPLEQKWGWQPELAAWSPDGTQLVVVDRNRICTTLERMSGKSRSQWPLPTDAAEWCLANDGRFVLCQVGTDLQVRASADGRRAYTCANAPLKPWFMDLSSDGTRAVTYAADRVLRLWNTETGEPLRAWPGLTETLRAGVLTADGRTFALVDQDSNVRVLDLLRGQLTEPLIGPAHGVNKLVWSPDAQLLAGCNRLGNVVVWQRDKAEPIWQAQLPGSVHGVTFAPDHRHLATANGNGTVYLIRFAK